jgi:putative transposase
MRNVLTKVPKGEGEMVATWIRTIFTMGTPSAVRAQLDHVAQTLAAGHPRVAQMLRDAKADVTAFSDFPQATDARSGRPTRSSGSTRRSNAAPTSSGSSPTPTRCCGSRPVS